MADIQKPDMSKQWANSGDKTPPADALINAGWASGDIPTNTDFNYIDARQDQGLAYVLQKGVPEWDASTEYQVNKSFAQYNGVLYKAIQTGVNKQPDTQAAYWKSLFDVKQNATGSVAYDLASFASQWVFPQMFSTLQAAIDYADSSNKVLAFPAGTYTYATAPNFAKSNLVLMALGEVVFHHTGTGSAFVLDAGPSGGVYNLQMIGDFCVKGNANTDTSAGVYIRAVHHSHIKIRAYDMPATAFYVAFGVLTHYDLTCSVNQQAFTITPTTGVVFNRRNTGEYVADCTMRLVMEGINGLGVDFQDVQGCRVEGTTEGNTYGFRDSPTCADNTFIGVWCEANTTRDYELHGQRNTFINCKSISAVAGANCEVVTAAGTSFIGGFWRHVNLQSTSSNTRFNGVSLSDNVALGIKGNGTFSVSGSYLVDVNGSKTSEIEDKSSFVPSGTNSVQTSVQNKLREVVSVLDKGGAISNTPAQNKTALQKAISDVDAAGGGYVTVPSGIDYGFKNINISTYPDFTGVVNDVVVIDYGIGDADNSGNKAGAQVRTFFHTSQTTPVGQHDGNGSWIYGNWHPYHGLMNTANLAAVGHPSRTAFDNRRLSILFNNDGESTWRLGQGTLAGAGYTDEELSNFVLEHYQSTGDTLPNYAPLTIERKTGRWAFGNSTNAPPADFFFRAVTAGSYTAMFESLSTTCEMRLRNTTGGTDDVSLKNLNGDLSFGIPSQGEALTVKKATRNIAIGSNGDYRLDVADNKANGYVAKIKNVSSTNGNGVIFDSTSTSGTGWSFARFFADNEVDEKFKLRGDGNAFADGSWSGGGADFAEYFEWQDGNPQGEDRRGVVVQLIGDKVAPATSAENAWAVVSVLPTVVGNAGWAEWHGKWLKDDFGDYILNEQGERTLNPEWDESKEYTPREQRKEWVMIGKLGRLRIKKGQPVKPSWKLLRNISDVVDEYWVD